MKQNQPSLGKHFLIAAGSNYEEKANRVGEVDATQVDQHVDVLLEKQQAQILTANNNNNKRKKNYPENKFLITMCFIFLKKQNKKMKIKRLAEALAIHQNVCGSRFIMCFDHIGIQTVLII